MTSMIPVITASAILAAVLFAGAMLVVWARKNTWLRAAAIPLAVLSAAASAAMFSLTLGLAVPFVAGITAPAGEVEMLSAKLVPNQGIYVTLDLPEAPRLFWMPWDRKKAEAIQEMLSDPGNAGVSAVLPPFEWSWSLEPPSFQPLPQPKVLPDKPVEPEDPKVPYFAA